jgi:radical SAM-linked protein
MIRFKFYKRNELKYLSHLDIVGIITRALNRAGLNLAYSQGYNPRPRISFSNPTPLGVESLAEYGDAYIEDDIREEDFKNRVNMKLRKEIQVVEARKAAGKIDSLMSQIDLVLYGFTLDTGSSGKTRKEELYREIVSSIKESDFSGSIFDIRGAASEGASNIIFLKLFGYAKILKEKNNMIFKFNNFYNFLKALSGEEGIGLSDIKKEELFVIRGDSLKTPVEII